MQAFLKTTVALAGMFTAHAMAADALTVVSFGGANKVAQAKAFYEPWERQSSGKVIAGEYNGEMARLKVMVDTHSVDWDVVEVELPMLEGLPTAEEHIGQQVQNSTPFWADYGESLEQRFNAWAAK
jgi:spermidine/putrescine-binding protein